MYGMDDLDALEDEEFDQDLLGEYTGAGVIFGATGGVMEAALRTLKQKLENKTLERVDFTECRGMAGVKEAQIDLNGQKIWIAITSSMTSAKPLLEDVRAGIVPAAASTAAASPSYRPERNTAGSATPIRTAG